MFEEHGLIWKGHILLLVEHSDWRNDEITAIEEKSQTYVAYEGLSWAVVQPAHRRINAAHWISLNLHRKQSIQWQSISSTIIINSGKQVLPYWGRKCYEEFWKEWRWNRRTFMALKEHIITVAVAHASKSYYVSLVLQCLSASKYSFRHYITRFQRKKKR